MNTTSYGEYKNKLLQNDELRIEYDALEEEFSLAKELIQLRKEKNMTQKQLAEQIGTSQPAIARLESGNYRNLSLSFLRKVAEALDAVTEIHLRKKTG